MNTLYVVVLFICTSIAVGALQFMIGIPVNQSLLTLIFIAVCVIGLRLMNELKELNRPNRSSQE